MAGRLTSRYWLAGALVVAAVCAPSAEGRDTFTVHPGHQRVFANARPGDKVVCVTATSSLAARVPKQTASASATVFVWDRHLELKVAPQVEGDGVEPEIVWLLAGVSGAPRLVRLGAAAGITAACHRH